LSRGLGKHVGSNSAYQIAVCVPRSDCLWLRVSVLDVTLDGDCSAEQSEQAAVRNSLSSSGESEENRMNRKEGKERWYLCSAILVRTHTQKALRHGSHSFTCNTVPAFPSYKRSPDGATTAEAADIQLQLTTHLSTPETMKG